MKVILKEDVDHLGKMGTLVEVKDGFARNYLLPNRKAVLATDKNTKELEHERKIIDIKLKKIKKEAEGLGERIQAVTLHIQVQAGEEDKLFGSVTAQDIVEALEKESISIDKKKILLEKPLKELGIFPVPVKLHSDVIANLKVSVEKLA
ncbi:MAG: 50S ribosomal protein L9 [Nitrospirae bacterium]|nr:50S ribosomal protein L9 [Nitrospirota bacterium]MBI3594229.1 50S ribosomal protein L9 [Nitrospirota bacterium]